MDRLDTREGAFPSLFQLFRCTGAIANSKADQIQDGFTLIELLIVMAIIGILAAIAIPNFLAYRQDAFEAVVKEDVHNVATAEEAYFATYQSYIAFGPITGPTTYSLGSGSDAVKVSRDVTMQASLNKGILTIKGTHPGVTASISYSTDIGVVQ